MHVGIILGSRSQWSTMQHSAKLLAQLGIAYEARIITTNKSTKQLHEYASNASNRGLEIIIAGSSGEAYLPGIIASKTEVPVVGIQMNRSSKKENICYSISDENIDNTIRMSNTGPEGAVNAALFVANMLAKKYPKIHEKLTRYHNQNNLEKLVQENVRHAANH